MKPAAPARSTEPPEIRSRPLLLAAIFFLLGVVITGIWFHHRQTGGNAGGLSTTTKNLLGQLSEPVTVRFYSLLPAGSADEPLQAFAGRVGHLLDAIQAASGGKVQINSIDTPAETNANAASADGIQAFNLDKGDACFLGLTIVSGKHKESFARLQPEWEPALEYDLIRAIMRVAAVPAPAKPAPEIARPNPEIVAAINRLIPDVKTASMETADQVFHADFMKQYADVSAESETQVSAAQQQVIQAENSGSAADIEAAHNHLAQVQAAQADKIKQLAANLKIEMAVFQQMKAGATNSVK